MADKATGAGPKTSPVGPASSTAGRRQSRARSVRLSLLRRSLIGLIILTGIILTPLTTRWPGSAPVLRDLVVMLGTLLIGIGAAIRLWAGLYIGGHKDRQLVTSGPYSCVRNPLYLGNLVATGGITALTGSPLVVTVILGATVAVYLATIRNEEHKLRPIFGAPFETYLRDVPALLPRLASFRRLIHDTTPCVITHRSLAREIPRCLGLTALGFLAFLLTVAAPVLHTHAAQLL
jgi:protein-S-isoprenylcysteine O-methyltransferase Ste14